MIVFVSVVVAVVVVLVPIVLIRGLADTQRLAPSDEVSNIPVSTYCFRYLRAGIRRRCIRSLQRCIIFIA